MTRAPWLTLVGDSATATATAEQGDDRVSVAVALLDRYVPIEQGGQESAELLALAKDPRYVIGRLQQALTALLSAELSPLDAQSELLAQVFDDALEYRRWIRHQSPQCIRCTEATACADHAGDWNVADSYDALCNSLGLTRAKPTRLSVVRAE